MKQCCIQQFFGGAGFLTSVGRRKTVMQLESVGGDVSCIQWGPEAKPPPPPPQDWLFCILNSSKHCSCGSATTSGEESLHQNQQF